MSRAFHEGAAAAEADPTRSRHGGAAPNPHIALMKPILPALLAAALAGSAAAAEPPIRPGCWESTNQVVSPIHQTSTTRKLISAADVDHFLTGPINHHYTCVYPTRRVAEGRLVMKGTCTDNKGRQLGVDTTGRYTPDSFHVDATIAMNFLGLPVQGHATTDARRIGDACPVEPATAS
jgi:hypothetical protein